MCPYCRTEPNVSDSKVCKTAEEAKKCVWFDAHKTSEVRALRKQGFSYSEATRRVLLELES